MESKISETGFIRFQRLMADFASEHMTREAIDHGMSSPDQETFMTIFRGFIEVSESMDALLMSELLITRSPPRGGVAIPRDEYLRYLISTYLQEIYILEQRLSSYAKKMARLYGRGCKESTAKLRLDALLKTISKVFEGIVRIRGSHVHEQRFSDEKLHYLGQITLIGKLKTKYVQEAIFEYRYVRREWKKTIKSNNAETKKIIDSYFDSLHALISIKDKLVLPRSGIAPRSKA